VSVRIGTGASEHDDARTAAIEAAAAARAGLGGARADVAVVFASGRHLASAEAALDGIFEALDPAQLVGCGAGGVLAGGREIEGGDAIVVWAAALAQGSVQAFRAEIHETEEHLAVGGVPDLEGATGVILLPDPYSFPTDQLLAEWGSTHPGVPVLGGLASGRRADGEGALFFGAEVVGGGAVGLRFEGVEILPCVSQGATPIGPELTVTAAEGHIISELAGRPALERLREAITGLAEDERAMITQGLLLGIVIDQNRPDYLQGDFLVRGLLGADPDAGTIAVGTRVSPGSVVRLHARDADSADRDLREALGLRSAALGGRVPAGALVFTCNGRGRGMFGVDDHDAAAVAAGLGGAPAAGFFAAGEIGPVGGETFLHGFTATVAVFPS
jgi:small ligand-binding sensory domain FIST